MIFLVDAAVLSGESLERPMDIAYPHGMDLVWIATDADRNLGAFITAGAAPIPKAVMSLQGVALEDVESLIFGLPIMGDHELLVPLSGSDDFIGLARRGFFAYDWTDVHKVSREYSRAYELMAVPLSPLKAGSVGGIVVDIAMSVPLPTLRFRNNSRIDILSHTDCIQCRG